MARIVIVGGGMAGLATAQQLRLRQAEFKRPFELLVLEAASQVGGWTRSCSREGFVLDTGTTAFHAGASATLALLQRLGLSDQLVPCPSSARQTYLLERDRLVPIPFRARDLLATRLVSALGRARLAAEPLASPAPSHEESVQEMLERRIGREAADLVGDLLVTLLFAGDPTQLSVQAALPALYRLEIDHGSLLRGLLEQQRQARERQAQDRGTPTRPPEAIPGPARPMFYTLRGGTSALVEALAETLSSNLRLGARAVEVLPHPGRRGPPHHVRLESGESLAADVLILAGPAFSSATLLGHLDPEAGGLLEQIPFEGLVSIHLGFPRACVREPLEGFGFILPRSSGQPLLGGQLVSSLAPHHAPPGQVLIRSLLGGARARGALQWDESRLLQTCLETLRVPLGLEGRPSFTHLERLPRALPQYTLGHLERLARLQSRLAFHPGLLITGNSFEGVSLNETLLAARRTADSAIALLKTLPGNE